MRRPNRNIDPPTTLPNVSAPPPPPGGLNGLNSSFIVRDEYGSAIGGVIVKERKTDRFYRVWYFTPESPLHLEAWLTKKLEEEHLLLISTCGDSYFIFKDLSVSFESESTKKGRLYDLALEYAAAWIENSLVGEENARVIEFGKNMAMSIRAAKEMKNDREP